MSDALSELRTQWVRFTHDTQWVTNFVLHPHMIHCILNEMILNESRTLSYIHTRYSMSHELCVTSTHDSLYTQWDDTQWVTNSVLHTHMVLNESRTLFYIHTWYSMSHELCVTSTHDTLCTQCDDTQCVTNSVLHTHMVLYVRCLLTWYSTHWPCSWRIDYYLWFTKVRTVLSIICHERDSFVTQHIGRVRDA